MFAFKAIGPENIPWGDIESCYDHHVYKSQAWVEHLVRCYHVNAYILEVHENEDLIGYFIGERFRRIVTIVAGGFEGWSTPFQGLSMLQPTGVSRRLEIYQALNEFLFREKICSYFQVADWQVDLPQVALAKMQYEVIAGYTLDLANSEEELLAGMRSSTRSIIRKAKCSTATNRITSNAEEFVNAHYDHLLDVFARQRLKPTKRKEEVREQILTMHKRRKALLMETVSADGELLASGFFVYDNKMAFIVSGGNSARASKMKVNEPLMFEALRTLKQRGVTLFELGGGQRFKEKYGPTPYVRPRIMACRFRIGILAKQLAKEGYYLARSIGASVRQAWFTAVGSAPEKIAEGRNRLLDEKHPLQGDESHRPEPAEVDAERAAGR